MKSRELSVHGCKGTGNGLNNPTNFTVPLKNLAICYKLLHLSNHSQPVKSQTNLLNGFMKSFMCTWWDSLNNRSNKGCLLKVSLSFKNNTLSQDFQGPSASPSNKHISCCKEGFSQTSSLITSGPKGTSSKIATNSSTWFFTTMHQLLCLAPLSILVYIMKIK